MATPALLRVIQLTPPGRGAVATLRIEGQGAVAVVGQLFRAASGRPLADCPADRLVVGRFGSSAATPPCANVKHENTTAQTQPGEEVVVRCCTDGAVEVHCHGGLAAVARIESLLATAGGECVSWQDWLADAYRDPIAAAAIADLTHAATERAAAILLDQFHGALRRAFDEIEQAIQGCAWQTVQQLTNALRAHAPLGLHLVKPWRVVLGGPVNVGKSSLINALVGYGRAIVHHTPGTTRDAVTAVTAIDGWPIEFCDTAGLREGEHAIEQAGIALAQQRLGEADLVVLVFDQSAPWSAEQQALLDHWPQALVVHNKSDLPANCSPRPAGQQVSAFHGDGLNDLLAAISNRLVPDPPAAGAAIPFRPEHVQFLEQAARSCPVCGNS